LGKICLQPPSPLKMGVNRQFQAKRQNIKIAISPKLYIGSKPNLRTELIPTIALCEWSNITHIKSNMAAGRHLEKMDRRHKSADDYPITTKFGRHMQNGMAVTIRRCISKPEIEFQYGGRPFSETGSCYLSRGLSYVIEIWYAYRFPPS